MGYSLSGLWGGQQGELWSEGGGGGGERHSAWVGLALWKVHTAHCNPTPLPPPHTISIPHGPPPHTPSPHSPLVVPARWLPSHSSAAG